MVKLGIDFGTTNSAVAILARGEPRILELVDGEPTQRTVIYSDPEGRITFGNQAFEAYLDNDLRGRFVRSIKSFLPHDVPPTRLGGVRLTFVELVARYLGFLVGAAERKTGERVSEVVVGRPVRFHADEAKHQRAIRQLHEAIEESGLPEPTMQLEPVAAALRYERRLDGDRTVLVGDFGGGTADFAVLRVGPGHRGATRDRVLGTSGIARAGNALDGHFFETFVLDFLGRGTTFVPRGQKTARPYEPHLFRQLRALYDLHRLREPQLERFLLDLEGRTSDPIAIERLRRLVFDDLGYPMAASIESAKRQFSDGPRSKFVFDAYFSPRLDFATDAEEGRFEAASTDLLGAYRDAVVEVLEASGLARSDIDDVFLTGGTSQLPFLRRQFEGAFGADRVQGGEAFTTVCEGLVVS